MKTILWFTLMLLLIFRLACFDAMDEDFHLGVSAVFASIPTAVLFIHDWLALEMKMKTTNVAFTFIYAVINNFVALIVYSGYAFNGPSQPDTAAHMHVFLFPVLLAVAAIPGLVLVSVIDRFCRKQSCGPERAQIE